MKITTIKHQNVRGHDQYYLNLEQGDTSYMMNVGKTTFETVNKMLENEKQPAKTGTGGKVADASSLGGR